MDGRVLQVSVSPGGVPKHPVERAWVGPLGLEGDRHRHTTLHGGPHRAVALFAIEAIERVQADGHPIEPGSAGENLTTSGIEIAALPIGTRLAIGEQLVLEISSPDNPCDVIAGSFRGGKSGRISILTHPTDSRMYARTLVEGEVRPGDEIRVLPPVDRVAAARHLLLERIESVTLEFTVALWRAVADAGFDIKVEEDGELAMAASVELPSATFNRALGHRTLPNLTDRMLAFYRDTRVSGWIAAEEPPWPGAVGDETITVFAAEPSVVAAAGAEASALDGSVTIREVERNEAALWSGTFVRASGMDGREADAWIAMTDRLVPAPGYHYFVAEEAGRPIAVGRMFARRRVGLLVTGTVDPSARGRGLQRALIAARVRIAAERGCSVVAAGALAGGVSATNLAMMGFQPVQEYALYRVPPLT